MALDKALSKKAGLTLAQLASYDDLVTDALVDRVSPIRPINALAHFIEI